MRGIICLVVMCFLGTSLIMFQDRFPFLYGLVLGLSGMFLFAASTKKVFIYHALGWYLWMIYGLLWPVYVSSFSLTLMVSLFYASNGLFLVWKDSPEQLHLVVYCLLFFIPLQTNLLPKIEPWDALLRLSLYFTTFGIEMYVKILLQRSHSLLRLCLITWWILMVSKWVVPLVGLQWTSSALAISEEFSKKIEQQPLSTNTLRSEAPEARAPRIRGTPPETRAPRTRGPPPRSGQSWKDFTRSRPNEPRSSPPQLSSKIKIMMDKGATINPV